MPADARAPAGGALPKSPQRWAIAGLGLQLVADVYYATTVDWGTGGFTRVGYTIAMVVFLVVTSLGLVPILLLRDRRTFRAGWITALVGGILATVAIFWMPMGLPMIVAGVLGWRWSRSL